MRPCAWGTTVRGGGRHFAVVAPPTPGHIDPLIALAAALTRHGHRVTFVHLPGAARLAHGELGFAAIGGPDRIDDYFALLARTTARRGLRQMIEATAAMTQALLDGAPAALERIGADAVLADSAEAAGPLLARRLGLPCIATVTGLPLLPDPAVPPPYLGWSYRPDAIGRARNRGGYAVARALLRPIDRVVEAQAAAWRLPKRGPQLAHVAQCPAALDFPRTTLPPRFHYGAPWRLPEEQAPELPDDGRPLVFCSLGSLQGRRAELLAAMAAACARVGARAVIAHGGGLDPATAAALPGDPLVQAWWPQRAVLARSAAAILHGGFNTVLDALGAGVPIVAVPIAFEQPGTAARLAWTGAGRVVPLRRAGEGALGAALRAVLTDASYRAAAARLGADIAGRDGAAEAAAAINAMLSEAPAADATASRGSGDARGDSRRSESR